MLQDQNHQSRAEKIANFNPDENGLTTNGIFGLPFSPEESQIVLLPVPWEVTVSYGTGTAKGPQAILEASQQLDLYDPIFPGGWRVGMAMEKVSQEWSSKSQLLRTQTNTYLENYGSESADKSVLESLNAATEDLRNWVARESKRLMDAGKTVGIIGGEHSVPLGYMQALAEKFESFGILQIDAHADLRVAYEGFQNSHASIMYNASHISNIEKIVQVGIRDFSEGENAIVRESEGRIIMYTDHEIKKSLLEGMGWRALADNIISHLPQNVYISYDIDGLQPWLCPNTGTPVPGGFQLEETTYLLEKLVESGRRIIGFDLCEVSPGEDEWDGNVGARVLYKLCLLAAKSNDLR